VHESLALRLGFDDNGTQALVFHFEVLYFIRLAFICKRFLSKFLLNFSLLLLKDDFFLLDLVFDIIDLIFQL